MNFIKKIAEEKVDDAVHLQFQKFSRGEFKDRALINAKNSKGNYTIKTSSEFANELVRILAEKLGDKKTKVTGAIISTQDLKNELKFIEIKQFQGVKKYLIDSEMSGSEIINLINKFPKNFFALSFDVDENSLKIKAKAPKSTKTKNKEAPAKPDFCKLKTNDKKIAESFVFEKPDFKDAEIRHTFFIDEIIPPNAQDLENLGTTKSKVVPTHRQPKDFVGEEKNFAKIRELAKRKGKIIRDAIIDGKNIKKEIDFVA